jgi:hypothetical protein
MRVVVAQSGVNGVRLPYKAAAAMQRHILNRTPPEYSVATLPATVDLAKVMVHSCPDAWTPPPPTVRAAVHAIVDAWPYP